MTSSRPSDTHTVTTTGGDVRGVLHDDPRRMPAGPVAAFQGIPYAAPPVGGLRFAPPEPHRGWTGVRPAARPGPAVPQLPSALSWLTGQPTPEWSEHGCLTLNVWSPADAVRGARPRPVLVWFHGGAFAGGSSGTECYDGARLAALGDIVVVTANFRIGPLGYLHLPEIGADNAGLLDQIAVLRWTRENIAAFGGDPAQLTVGGQSSGAYTALLLALSPEAGPLIRRVIAQSAPLNLPAQDPHQAAESTAGYLRALDVPAGTGPTQTAAALRKLPVEQLLDGYRTVRAEALRAGRTAPPMYPVLGGAALPRPPFDAVADGALHGTDVLVGTTADEMTAFLTHDDRIRTADRAAAVGMLTTWLGGDRDRAEETYVRYTARRPGGTPARILTDVASDLHWRSGVTDLAERRSGPGDLTYVYRFDRCPYGEGDNLTGNGDGHDENGGRGDGSIGTIDSVGASHCAELPFLFGSFAAYRGSTLLGALGGPDDPRRLRAEALFHRFAGALAAFVTTGSPNGAGLAPWPPYIEGADEGGVRSFDEGEPEHPAQATRP
ncbi:carboxylesterase/lipase family protein [Streptomyces natalensis]|uniref:carboxylesterase/lipase family protein n=1 Tax=Streptomyces natalensis TaxID=68242 RepID=UPI0007C5B44A|nr:carboxylesterase family protein [Streptomyces natalensis]